MGNNGTKITAPVSMTDIATVIGDSTDMANSVNINDWSKNRPFEPHENLYIVQDDAARRKAAYGFYWWNFTRESEAPFASNAKDLLDRAIANNGKWKRKPITVSRMGDYDGYNHAARPPYAYSGTSNDAAAQNPKYLMVTSADPNNPNIEITLSDMPDFTGDWGMSMGDLELVVIYRRHDLNGTPYVLNTGMYIADLDVSPYTVESGGLSLTSNGTWDYIWAATNNDDLWMYLPNSLGTMVLADGLVIKWEWGSGEFEAYNTSGYTITSDSGVVESMQFYLTGENKYGHDLDIEYTLKIWNRSNANEGYEYAITKIYDIETIGEYFQPLWDTVEINTAEVSAKPSDCMLTLDMRYKRSGASATEQWTSKHYNFLTEQLESYASTEADGVSVWDIIQYVNSK